MRPGLIASGPRTAARGGFAALFGTIVVCVVAAGCGSSGRTTTTSSTARTTQALAFSRCMRAHGVPGFPDPGASISGPYNSIGGIAFPQTIDTQAPVFRAAMNNCRGLISASFSTQGKPPITASLKASLIAQAQCMRTHGVPGYQDPTFPIGGGIAVTDAGTDPDSPAYKHASAICGKR